MIKFFRHLRFDLMEKNKTGKPAWLAGKYLKYAVGEIILVVIGILIALSINNLNEKRKDQNKLLNIYSLIYDDIENDIQDLINNLEFYNQKKSVFEKVVHDSITPDLLDEGISRLLVLGGNRGTTLNTTGVNQLRELQNKDSLTLKLIGIYDVMETIMLTTENRISNETKDHAEYLRDNYDWYPEWIYNTIMRDVGSKELHDYFLTSPIYRNRVVSVYQQVYNNYTTILNTAIKRLTELQKELRSVLDKTNK